MLNVSLNFKYIQIKADTLSHLILLLFEITSVFLHQMVTLVLLYSSKETQKYLRLLLFPKTGMTQVVELLLCGR